VVGLFREGVVIITSESCKTRGEGWSGAGRHVRGTFADVAGMVHGLSVPEGSKDGDAPGP